MKHSLTFRAETPDDVAGISTVVQAAFGRPDEADLVDHLRRSGALVLSAVAANEEGVAGYVGFSRVTVGESHEALALAPAAVSPDWQRLGVASTLILWALDECRRQGHTVVVVLGAPAFYGRFGFRPAARFGVECPFAAPSENFMLLELVAGAAQGWGGPVRYPPEFDLE